MHWTLNIFEHIEWCLVTAALVVVDQWTQFIHNSDGWHVIHVEGVAWHVAGAGVIACYMVIIQYAAE